MVEHKFNINKPVIALWVRVESEKTKEDILMALDTGATYMMLPWEIAEILGHEPHLSKERIDMTTASDIEKVPLITLKSVNVLGKKAANVPAVVHDLPSRSCVDGLLGLSFLKHFKICQDFKKGILTID